MGDDIERVVALGPRQQGSEADAERVAGTELRHDARWDLEAVGGGNDQVSEPDGIAVSSGAGRAGAPPEDGVDARDERGDPVEELADLEVGFAGQDTSSRAAFV